MAKEKALPRVRLPKLRRSLLATALATAAVLGVVAAVAFYSLSRQQESTSAAEVRPGRPAPDFKVALLNGGTFRLSEQRGRPTVVNFWYASCPPCRLEMPDFEQTWREYKDRGLVLVGINPSDTAEEARRFVDEIGVTYPIGLDTDLQVLLNYRVLFFPTTVFIHRDGTILRTHLGYLDGELLRGYVEELLQ